MTNNDLFGVFAVHALANLYESFPVPKRPQREKMTTFISAQESLWSARSELSTVEGKESLLNDFRLLTPELSDKAHTIRTALEEKSAIQKTNLETITAIYDGTLYFLGMEGYIREKSSGVYQLTSKGLAQLNKRFDQGGISTNITIVQKVRDALLPDKFLGAVTSGTLVSLAGKILDF